MSEADPSSIDAFIRRWAASGAAERANYQLFLSELCDVLEVPRPEPQAADDAQNSYVFEKAVPLPHGTTGRIDLYKRGCFVLEAKQGSDWVGWGWPDTEFLQETRCLSSPPAAGDGDTRYVDVGHGDGAGTRAGAALCAQSAAGGVGRGGGRCAAC